MRNGKPAVLYVNGAGLFLDVIENFHMKQTLIEVPCFRAPVKNLYAPVMHPCGAQDMKVRLCLLPASDVWASSLFYEGSRAPRRARCCGASMSTVSATILRRSRWLKMCSAPRRRFSALTGRFRWGARSRRATRWNAGGNAPPPHGRQPRNPARGFPDPPCKSSSGLVICRNWVDFSSLLGQAGSNGRVALWVAGTELGKGIRHCPIPVIWRAFTEIPS